MQPHERQSTSAQSPHSAYLRVRKVVLVLLEQLAQLGLVHRTAAVLVALLVLLLPLEQVADKVLELAERERLRAVEIDQRHHPLQRARNLLKVKVANNCIAID